MVRVLKVNKRAAIVVLALLFPVFFLSISHAGLKERAWETALPNGLKVILLEDHKAPLVTFQVWYRVGSRNEEWGRTGLSHMLEHMMFKGTPTVGPEEFSRIIQENGGDDNAFTSRDFTGYFENLAADRIQVAIDLEADRMQNLRLREEDFKTERMVVMEERRLRTDDNPQAYLGEQVEATAYQVHPYHWPTVGWMEDIARFTLDDLKKYHRTYYIPANAFLVAVGDFQKEEVLGKIQKAFGTIPAGSPPDQKKDPEPPQSGERRIYVKREAHLPFIMMGYHVPNLRETDGYVLEVIAAILSEGKSSRLYQSLIQQKRIALDADAENSLHSRDPGLFFLTATPLPGQDAAAVEKALEAEVELLQKEPVSPREMEKAKNQIEAGFVYGQDSLFYQAMLLAQNEIALSWKAIDDYIPAIRKVTPEDIRRVARKYLTPDNRIVGILIPLPPQKGKPSQAGGGIPEKMIR
jgi:zinc protease